MCEVFLSFTFKIGQEMIAVTQFVSKFSKIENLRYLGKSPMKKLKLLKFILEMTGSNKQTKTR